MTVAETRQLLREQLAELHRLRQAHAVERRALEALRETSTLAFEAANAALIERVIDLQVALMDLDNHVRQAIVAAATTYGSEALPAGAGTRTHQVYEYEAKEAEAWARQKGMALAFDAKAFQALIEADPASFPFVHPKPDTIATISKDLTRALEVPA